ncbi:MAG: hypothetical protein HY430_02615 [Candidatus Levybacteria bacterium]|nr:hypothetical protein [Candidatus Levybacteria bacterium]
MNFRYFIPRGQSLIEILLVIGLTALLLPALLTGLFASRQGKAQELQRSEATSLLQEAHEALRVVRENGWNTFAVNGTYHPQITGSTWTLASGTELVNGYTRKIDLSDARRDATGAIVATGGTIDPSTKKAVVSVTWSTPFLTTVSSTLYLTRYQNEIYTETTAAQFTTGTHTGTTVTNTDGGEVVLGAGGQGDWCAPDLTITALDLPKNGVANAVSAIEGKAFAGTGENSSGVSYATVDINNTNPPVATLGDTFDGYKTNDVFGETNYAYLATDNNGKEIVIIDLTQVVNGKYVEAGFFNAPGNGNGDSVFVTSSYGYMTSGNKFYNFRKIGSSSSIDADGVTLAGTGKSVYVVGNYAYVAISDSTTRMQIIDISNPTNLTIAAQAIIASAGDGRDVFVNSSGTRAYLALATSTQKEMYIINTTTKSGDLPVVGTGYETNGMSPKGITVVPGNKAIIVGTGGEEYQAINIANELSPARCGGLQVDAGINGVASIIEEDGDAYSYIITGDASSEFKIIEGGPGGQYATSGTYESTTFDPGSEVAYNRISPSTDILPLTDIRFQVAIADAISNSCSGVAFAFVGPDGTSGTYYATTSAIALHDDGTGYENPGRCLRYKAFFSTTDSTQSPTLYDVTTNYSL